MAVWDNSKMLASNDFKSVSINIEDTDFDIEVWGQKGLSFNADSAMEQEEGKGRNIVVQTPGEKTREGTFTVLLAELHLWYAHEDYPKNDTSGNLTPITSLAPMTIIAEAPAGFANNPGKIVYKFNSVRFTSDSGEFNMDGEPTVDLNFVYGSLERTFSGGIIADADEAAAE